MLLGVFAFVHELAQRPDRLTLSWLAVRLAAALALALGAWGLVSSATTRRTLGHWPRAELRPLLWRELGFIGLLLAGGTVGILVSSLVIGLVVGAVQIFVCWFGHQLSKEIAKTIHGIAGLETVTEHYARGSRLHRWISGSKETNEEASSGEDAGPLQRFLGWFFARRSGQLVSRFRLVAAGALLLFGVLAVIAGAVELASRSTEPSRSRSDAQAQQPTKPRLRPSPRSHGTPLPPSSSRASQAPSPDETSELRPCGPNATPGRGAPRWARDVLYALYLGGRSNPPRVKPPGAVGGYTGPVLTSPGIADFFFTFGTIPGTGELRSVAVATRRFQSAIFIAPAVTPVVALIQRYGEIGGYARLDVGLADRGDCYAVQTPDGIVMLVRVAKTAAHGGAGQYVELPPAVTAAWWDAMSERGGQWLWPLAQPYGASGTTFRLVADPSSKAAFDDTIVYDAASRIATRTLSTGTRSYGPAGVTFAESELIDRAATAR
jgi:hypothetical protein